MPQPEMSSRHSCPQPVCADMTGGRRPLQRSASVQTYMVRVRPGVLAPAADFVGVESVKTSSASDVAAAAAGRLGLTGSYELAECFSVGGQVCKERRLGAAENPVRVQLLWPRTATATPAGDRAEYAFHLRRRTLTTAPTAAWTDQTEASPLEAFLSRRHTSTTSDTADLCALPDLSEDTLLEHLQRRFDDGEIYTYVGAILIAVNPFRFLPIYNPKYVGLYQHRRREDLPPHVFAVADAAYGAMLATRQRQCVVISGESGSGKTETTNLLLHQLSALSQRALRGDGVEQTILGAGPVMEAFGNAKTLHNNNSSRFGKFIQLQFKENGMLHGAIVEKYLLEKSRIVSQLNNERNYHVFYYLLAGATEEEKRCLSLREPADFHYLAQSDCYTLEDIEGELVDEAHEFTRLRQSMEIVGFSRTISNRIFSVLAAVLHLGNIDFRQKSGHAYHESITIENTDVVKIISSLLKVKESTLIDALTKKKTMAGGEAVVMNHNLADATATRDALAKCLYGSLFDWIVMQLNYALLSKREHREHQGNSIGVLDIFGFEDFNHNSFEQFCINYANEHLQYYFNQHIFKFEQEEYVREGIEWSNIEFIDNTGCLTLFSKRRTGLLCLLDEESNLPGATNSTLLDKFHNHHQGNEYYEAPQIREDAFFIVHYAGLVKYHIQDFREKNSDLMRNDIILVLKNSRLSFVRELVSYDPVAVLRWAILRAFFRAYFAFKSSGRRRSTGGSLTDVSRAVSHPNSQGEKIGDMRNLFQVTLAYSVLRRIQRNKSFKPRSRQVKQLRDLRAMKAMVGRTPLGPRLSKGSNKPPSVSCQFNISLQKMLHTLNETNPFFIRCIRSNVNKVACLFDRSVVLRQLRYTGMLATVRIRQSGYNYRLPFAHFALQYQILLPGGATSTRDDVERFLMQLDLNRDNYQIGRTKVFLREAEKMLLDHTLHRAIMKRIVLIQRWMKMKLQRAAFLRLRTATVTIQRRVRVVLAARRARELLEHRAAIAVQRTWRGHAARRLLRRRHLAATVIQKTYRGYLAREQFKIVQEQEERERRRRERRLARDLYEREEAARRRHRHDDQRRHLRLDGLSSSDEGILTKGSSGEELPPAALLPPPPATAAGDRVYTPDSEGSSGILEDSESEVQSADFDGPGGRPPHPARSGASSTASPPSTPTSPLMPGGAFSRQRQVTRHTAASIKFGRFTTTTTTTTTTSTQQQPSQPPLQPEKTVSSSALRTQAGPCDIEVHVRPAVLTKSSSVDVLRTYEAGRAQVERRENRVSAPLAKQESFNDVEESDRLEKLHPRDDGSAAAPSTYRSPLHITRNVFKNFIGEFDGKKRRKSCVEIGLHKQMTLAPSRTSKISLRDVLRQQRSKKMKSSKSFEYDSDDSQIDDPHHIDGVSPWPGLTPPHGPTPSSVDGLARGKKSKETWPSSSDCSETAQPRKPKQRRKLSKKRRGDAAAAAAAGGDGGSAPPLGNNATWSVAGTSQWQYPTLLLVCNHTDLYQLHQFVYHKILEYSRDCSKRDTIFDSVFKAALRELHTSLLTNLSISRQESRVELSYRHLMCNFEETLKAESRREGQDQAFPITLAINAFRGFLNEFHKKKENHDLPDVPKVKKEKKKKDKDKDHGFSYHGHGYVLTQFSIPTYCEFCSSIIWMVEKGQVCHTCKYTVHKKCCLKSAVRCKGYMDIQKSQNKNHVIGAPLASLLNGHKVPALVERLIRAIELNGLYTVGIYRKPGAEVKIRRLIVLINSDLDSIDFNDCHVHILTAVLKTFFRELPEPLLSYDLYDDFMRTAKISDRKERVQSIYSIVEKLQPMNYDLLERLMFHLAKIALRESANRMSAHSLAIIIAPSILKTSRLLTAQDSLNHVSKQTLCIECIIEEQMHKIRHTLADIRTLDSAEATAADRLSVVRASIRAHSTSEGVPEKPVSPEVLQLEEEKKLSDHIISLQQEREELTIELPTLQCRMSSSEEDLLSTDDIESTADDELEERPEREPEPEPEPGTGAGAGGAGAPAAATFQVPVTPSKDLRHLTLSRVQLPRRRLPSRRTSSVDDGDGGDGDDVEAALMYRRPSSPKISLTLKQIGDEILV